MALDLKAIKEYGEKLFIRQQENLGILINNLKSETDTLKNGDEGESILNDQRPI